MLSSFEATATRRTALLATLLAITISILIATSSAAAQSTKGARQSVGYAAPAAPAQTRGPQQAYGASQSPKSGSSTATGGSTKRRQQQQQQQREDQQVATEDPLADSEPALYGSVAGQPGVDFPGYTRIPKTSFTCDGKGYDFGFYADEEAGCQVYHVCWSGRRESFLCGVGTVFNQAILACDYWHSVDCSKSSQFYSVNSELGKAGAEPASSGSQRIQPARANQATLPVSSGNSLGYGENLNQKRTSQQQPQQQQQQQQQQYSTSSPTNQIPDDSNFDVPQQQQQQVQQQQQQVVDLAPTQIQQQPLYGAKSDNNRQTNGYQTTATFAPQRSQVVEYQQRASDTKTNQRAPTTTLATPAAPKRPRFNMDFNQKVNSLIESPVRPPIKTSGQLTTQQPSKQRLNQQQRPANFAQLAVSRAQQSGSQSLNLGPARKSNSQQVYQPQQKQVYETDEEPQQQVIQQQHQQSFDDSPVQTSTASSGNYAPIRQNTPTNSISNQFGPQQQLVVQSGGGPDGSSAITSQYDTLNPASGGSSSADQNYESSLDESSSNPNDDFRSSGAKAAASHNQNWYIMRSI